jgi:hypothetical protein
MTERAEKIKDVEGEFSGAEQAFQAVHRSSSGRIAVLYNGCGGKANSAAAKARPREVVKSQTDR